MLFVDNRDSFVHTLGDYVRQTGAEVVTVRAARSCDGSRVRGLRNPQRVFADFDPDLVFISPGPGMPEEFGVPELVNECVRRELPVFGVCLGLQASVEALGGELGVLSLPDARQKFDGPLHARREFSMDFPTEFVAGPLPLALTPCQRSCQRVCGSWRRPTTESSWPWSIASCQWRPYSFTPSRS